MSGGVGGGPGDPAPLPDLRGEGLDVLGPPGRGPSSAGECRRAGGFDAAASSVRGSGRPGRRRATAARYHQTPGAVPADVDVLEVGAADADELYEAAEKAPRRLGP